MVKTFFLRQSCNMYVHIGDMTEHVFRTTCLTWEAAEPNDLDFMKGFRDILLWSGALDGILDHHPDLSIALRSLSKSAVGNMIPISSSGEDRE